MKIKDKREREKKIGKEISLKVVLRLSFNNIIQNDDGTEKIDLQKILNVMASIPTVMWSKSECLVTDLHLKILQYPVVTLSCPVRTDSISTPPTSLSLPTICAPFGHPESMAKIRGCYILPLPSHHAWCEGWPKEQRQPKVLG